MKNLWNAGFASLGKLLDDGECAGLIVLYEDEERFRSRIDMKRYRFGSGEYRYFAYPLPPLVAELRKRLYAQLALVANDWMQALRLNARFPGTHPEFLVLCQEAGQRKPTPLLLRYGAGDFNCLHQDLYGEIYFPFQVIVQLTQAGEDFAGGELMLVEQRPRAQSVGHVLRPAKGEATVIATRYRPVPGNRGYSRGSLRHGVSAVHSGTRWTLGIVFHDAQ